MRGDGRQSGFTAATVAGGEGEKSGFTAATVAGEGEKSSFTATQEWQTFPV